MAGQDEVVIRVRLAEVSKAVADAKQVKGSVEGIGDGVDRADKKSRVASAAAGGFGLLGKALGAVGRAAAYSGVAVAGASVVLGRQAVTAASDLNQTLAKTDQVFGSSAEGMRSWATTSATTFGQSQTQALTAAANYGNLFRNLGMTEDAAASMSRQLVVTASDLAQFNNTSPQEMLEGISSALAGEYDPLQRYGFAISAAAVEQEALRMGLARSAKDLTAAQKAQASYALILKQTGAAAGQFGRESQTLTGQQAIWAGQWENLKAKAGTALIPTLTRFYLLLNTQLAPALEDLVDRYGPRVTKFFEDFELSMPDAATTANLSDIGGSIADIGRSLAQASGSGSSGLADTFDVAAVAIGFLADHVDTLADAMPYLVGAVIAYKVAQAGANVAALLTIPLTIVQTVANFALARALRQVAASQGIAAAAGLTNAGAQGVATAATTAGAAASGRGRVATLALAAAQRIAGIASLVFSVGMRAVGVAVRFAMGPVGLIITGIGLLVAGVIYAYRHSDRFRGAVHALGRGFQWLWDRIRALAGWVRDSFPNAFRSAINGILRAWNALDLSIDIRMPDWVPGIGGRGWQTADLFPDVPMLATGGTATSPGAAIVGERGPELISMPRGASVVPLDHPAAGPLTAREQVIITKVYLDGRQIQESVQRTSDDREARL